MTDSAAGLEWIAVDWGTTNLRAWAMAADSVVATATAPLGMGGLARHEFEPALLKVVGAWLTEGRTMAVVACGMVGARQGWVEVPYAIVPGAPHVGRAMHRVETADPRVEVTIVHGLSQAQPPDVMRGEETQIAGLLALEPDFAGVACLPGTHSKWVSIEGGRVERFRTFMTGELFALTTMQSILRHTVAGDDAGIDGAAFDAAVEEAAAEPAALAAGLFSTRAAGLLGDMPSDRARGRISGLLIGMEVEAIRAAWSGTGVSIIGEGALAGLYARALAVLGAKDARQLDTDRCTLAGLLAARKLL